jgi:hypothetical protein
MFDADKIFKTIGEDAYKAFHESNLPKIETMTLLQIWTQSSPKKLKALAQSGDLLPVLKKQYRLGLEIAQETRINNPHLTQTECLQVAGLPLTL